MDTASEHKPSSRDLRLADHPDVQETMERVYDDRRTDLYQVRWRPVGA